jgi:hypothetical protein
MPLVTHWIVERLACSSAARLRSDTLTIVVLNSGMKAPATATAVIQIENPVCWTPSDGVFHWWSLFKMPVVSFGVGTDIRGQFHSPR